MEIAGIIILPIILALAQAGGVGGGGIIVPFCILFFGFDTKEAVAQSAFCLFIAAFTRWFVNWRERHPEKNATSIDYGLASIMLPTEMLGSLCGVFLNIIMPSVVVMIALTILLLIILGFTIKKANHLY